MLFILSLSTILCIRCQRFFFTRKNQKCPWKLFLAFFRLFSRMENGFHAHFFRIFHGRSKYFTGSYKDFFTGGFFFFFTVRKWEILNNFHARLFFHRYKTRSNSSNFMERVSYFFTHFRFHFPVFDLEEISRTQLMFSWAIFKFFSRKEKKNHVRNSELVENFHRRDFDWSGYHKFPSIFCTLCKCIWKVYT